jgi:hypothetical protein
VSTNLSTFVPSARLAHLLTISRCESGLTLEDIHEALDRRFTILQLMQLEAAVLRIGDTELRAIAKAYQLDYDSFAPGRGLLLIDLVGGLISIGDFEAVIEAGSNNVEVLIRYMALLYNLREKKPGEDLVLRDPDIDVLAKAFSCTTDQVRNALHHVMQNNIAEIRTQLKALNRRPLFLHRLPFGKSS